MGCYVVYYEHGECVGCYFVQTTSVGEGTKVVENVMATTS